MSDSTLHVVVPGTGGRWWCGGLLIALRAAELFRAHGPCQVLTSHEDEPDVDTLDLALDRAAPEDVFLVTWGPHVNDLQQRLRDRRIVYYAQSPGWGIELSPETAVVTLSRFLMAYWAERAPHQPLNLLPPVLDPACVDPGRERDIDVLVVTRKSTPYLRDRLVPSLVDHCRVHVQEEVVERRALIELYQRARVYLYSSTPQAYATGPGAGQWVEGFGLQPLEAVACGCRVFSNLHGGLSDYLEPDVNAWKLETHSLDHDRRRILAAVSGALEPAGDPGELRDRYSEAAFHERAERLLPAWHEWFDAVGSAPADIPLAVAPRRGRLGRRR